MYKLYIDVIFLVNFLPEYLIFSMTLHILHYHAGKFRIVCGSIVTSMITCVLLILPGVPYVIRLLAAQLIGKTFVLWVILRIRKSSYFLKAMLLSCSLTFMIGGFLEWVCRTSFIIGHRQIHVAAFLMITGGSYMLFTFLLKVWNRLGGHEKLIRNVHIYYRENQVRVRGLVDTGNMLSEPIGGKPVCILDRNQARALGYREAPENYRAIPYYSIGTPGGILHGFTADEMVIEDESGSICIKKPVLGVCERRVSTAGTYDLILNTKLLQQERRPYVN